MATVRCALHVHSTWSDGECSLEELRARYVADGVGIVAMADHDYSFTGESLSGYVAACAAVSDQRILFVPGLEYECADRMHIVGFGSTVLVASQEPEKVIAHIEQVGGISVIAHPRDAHFDIIAGLATIPSGLEVWNSKYDGKYAPRARTFALFHRLRERRGDLRAFYGQDLHWKSQFRALYTDVTVDEVSPEGLLAALRAGAFEGVKGAWRLPSDGAVAPDLLQHFDTLNARSSAVWRALRRLKGMTGWLGRHVPGPIKAQLRRLF